MTSIKKKLVSFSSHIESHKVKGREQKAHSEVQRNWEYQASPVFLQPLRNQSHFTHQPSANQINETETEY